MYIEKTCVVCNDVFTVLNNKRSLEVQTCSKSCASKLAIENSKIQSKCVKCGKETICYRHSFNANLPIYCNDCSKKRYSLTCENCGTIFDSSKYNTKTCSTKCSSEYKDAHLVFVYCDECGELFARPSYTVASNKKVFCSKTCNERNFARLNPTRYGGTWTRWLRDIHNRDKCCISCGSNENLEVHHFKKLKHFVNPNDAHYEDNLGLFCHVCHIKIENTDISSLTEFYLRYSPYSCENKRDKQK